MFLWKIYNQGQQEPPGWQQQQQKPPVDRAATEAGEVRARRRAVELYLLEAREDSAARRQGRGGDELRMRPAAPVESSGSGGRRRRCRHGRRSLERTTGLRVRRHRCGGGGPRRAHAPPIRRAASAGSEGWFCGCECSGEVGVVRTWFSETQVSYSSEFQCFFFFFFCEIRVSVKDR